ncbi:hypothetical protein WR25_01778 [Diploscapter pachys]|uniref:Uncharacterized protein n=1 Tax=Diploscapter pachys TaxID=2018661 RepID=A0A2A2JIM3_9BILA|nr:hypothetical protein WR25_01778 [Diploscapter pachys]
MPRYAPIMKISKCQELGTNVHVEGKDIAVNFRKQVYAQTSEILASPSVIPTKTDLDKKDRPRFEKSVLDQLIR